MLFGKHPLWPDFINHEISRSPAQQESLGHSSASDSVRAVEGRLFDWSRRLFGHVSDPEAKPTDQILLNSVAYAFLSLNPAGAATAGLIIPVRDGKTRSTACMLAVDVSGVELGSLSKAIVQPLCDSVTPITEASDLAGLFGILKTLHTKVSAVQGVPGSRQPDPEPARRAQFMTAVRADDQGSLIVLNELLGDVSRARATRGDGWNPDAILPRIRVPRGPGPVGETLVLWARLAQYLAGGTPEVFVTAPLSGPEWVDVLLGPWQTKDLGFLGYGLVGKGNYTAARGRAPDAATRESIEAKIRAWEAGEASQALPRSGLGKILQDARERQLPSGQAATARQVTPRPAPLVGSGSAPSKRGHLGKRRTARIAVGVACVVLLAAGATWLVMGAGDTDDGDKTGDKTGDKITVTRTDDPKRDPPPEVDKGESRPTPSQDDRMDRLVEGWREQFAQYKEASELAKLVDGGSPNKDRMDLEAELNNVAEQYYGVGFSAGGPELDVAKVPGTSSRKKRDVEEGLEAFVSSVLESSTSKVKELRAADENWWRPIVERWGRDRPGERAASEDFAAITQEVHELTSRREKFVRTDRDVRELLRQGGVEAGESVFAEHYQKSGVSVEDIVQSVGTDLGIRAKAIAALKSIKTDCVATTPDELAELQNQEVRQRSWIPEVNEALEVASGIDAIRTADFTQLEAVLKGNQGTECWRLSAALSRVMGREFSVDLLQVAGGTIDRFTVADPERERKLLRDWATMGLIGASEDSYPQLVSTVAELQLGWATWVESDRKIAGWKQAAEKSEEAAAIAMSQLQDWIGSGPAGLKEERDRVGQQLRDAKPPSTRRRVLDWESATPMKKGWKRKVQEDRGDVPGSIELSLDNPAWTIRFVKVGPEESVVAYVSVTELTVIQAAAMGFHSTDDDQDFATWTKTPNGGVQPAEFWIRGWSRNPTAPAIQLGRTSEVEEHRWHLPLNWQSWDSMKETLTNGGFRMPREEELRTLPMEGSPNLRDGSHDSWLKDIKSKEKLPSDLALTGETAAKLLVPIELGDRRLSSRRLDESALFRFSRVPVDPSKFVDLKGNVAEAVTAGGDPAAYGGSALSYPYPDSFVRIKDPAKRFVDLGGRAAFDCGFKNEEVPGTDVNAQQFFKQLRWLRPAPEPSTDPS
jgi:hypothetical protein